MDSVKQAALLVVVHSTLFSYAVQHGEFTPSVGVVRCTFDRPAVKKRLSARPVPARYPREDTRFCQDTAVGPSHCPDFGSFTLDDLISGSGECSLTEDDVVAYVQSGDPTERDWDDWPLRMTYRINAFLRANPDHPESDLDILNAF